MASSPKPGPIRLPMTSICFIAANPEWGASEFLWTDAARAATARAGITVSASVIDSFVGVKSIQRLEASGCRLLVRTADADRKAFGIGEVPLGPAREVLGLRPDLVVVSQGDNREGLGWMEFCADQNLPFVSLAHRATEWDWPDDAIARRLRSAYLAARAAHFVSEHNRRLTEQVICAQLPHATTVRNPYNVSYSAVLPWPEEDRPLRMACVARLDLDSKAHDALFNVLGTPKWKQRALYVDVVGGRGRIDRSCVVSASSWGCRRSGSATRSPTSARCGRSAMHSSCLPGKRGFRWRSWRRCWRDAHAW